jgi:hypothetical protein
MQSSYNVIRRNVISGVYNAITVGYDPTITSSWQTVQGNSFQENIIGLDPTGTFAIRNDSDGIFLGAGATGNWIGPGNVLSGNASAAIELLHWTTSWNIVFSNIIGLNAAGTASIPNGELGILITNGSNQNVIGGAWGGNVISGNNFTGIKIGDVYHPNGTRVFGDAWGNWIQNNWIGLDLTGTVPRGNSIVGIHIRGGGSYWNTVSDNVIVANRHYGVFLQGTAGNWVEANYIGVTWSGIPMGNGDVGVLLDQSAWNTVINNVVLHNGAPPGTHPSGQIQERNQSHSNVLSPNTLP